MRDKNNKRKALFSFQLSADVKRTLNNISRARILLYFCNKNMSYTSRHRYKNRREKFKQTKRKTSIVLILIILALTFLAIRNWQALKDWYITTFT